VVDPRATNEDLTAKARIRNSAMDLYAQYGEERVSLRAVAAEAGVTVGLVQHHYKTKAGLRAAVDQLVVDFFAAAILGVPTLQNAAEYAAARDEAVRTMLQDNPMVVNYIRRAVLDPESGGLPLLDRILELTQTEVAALRKAGLASDRRSASTQVIAVIMRQFGELLMQPLIDSMWERVGKHGEPKPRIAITVVE
jgi:AcrR family transcriptional regulator